MGILQAKKDFAMVIIADAEVRRGIMAMPTVQDASAELAELDVYIRLVQLQLSESSLSAVQQAIAQAALYFKAQYVYLDMMRPLPVGKVALLPATYTRAYLSAMRRDCLHALQQLQLKAPPTATQQELRSELPADFFQELPIAKTPIDLSFFVDSIALYEVNAGQQLLGHPIRIPFGNKDKESGQLSFF